MCANLGTGTAHMDADMWSERKKRGRPFTGASLPLLEMSLWQWIKLANGGNIRGQKTPKVVPSARAQNQRR